MWSLLELLADLFRLGSSIDPKTGDKFHRASGRFLERGRWLIYALIGFSILLLIVVGVLLMMTP
jgi:hypothetical protein